MLSIFHSSIPFPEYNDITYLSCSRIITLKPFMNKLLFPISTTKLLVSMCIEVTEP